MPKPVARSGPKRPFRYFKLFTSRAVNHVEPFFTATIHSRGRVTCFLPLVAIHALYCSATLVLSVVSFLVGGSFALFRQIVMARVRSITRLRNDAPVQEGEGAVTERGAVGEGRMSVGSAERTKSVRVSDVGSQSNAEDDSGGGSCTRSCNFDLSTVTVSRIRDMIDHGYFAEGGAHTPGEETIPKPKNDEPIIFEEFFTAGFRIPPHPVLADILLKFQVQLHQLTNNVIARLSKYCWVVVIFGGVPSADGFAKRYELHYQPQKMEVGGADVQAQYGCINFHAKCYGGHRAKLMLAVRVRVCTCFTRE
jgi:hypothetical protein